jgi:DNA-directed RNA polymerase specialized sigma24 family protein
MSSKPSTAKKEAEFSLWIILSEILTGGRPIEDLVAHRGFQRLANRLSARVMRRYNGIMRMYYGVSYEAEDLFIEVCMRMINYWHRREALGRRPDGTNFPNEKAFSAWLFVLALNVVRSKLRKFKELQEDGVTLIYVPIDDLDIADDRVQLEWQSFCKQFLEFTETLNENHRRATRLWYEGYSAREIKKALNDAGIKCSHVAVQSWVKSSLEAFEKSIGPGPDGGGGRDEDGHAGLGGRCA